MKDWPWQKKVSKILALAIGVGGTVFAFTGVIPQWWALITSVVILIEEWIMTNFPSGESETPF